MAKTAKKTTKQTIGDLIDNLFELREDIRAQNKIIDGLKGEKAEIEAQLMERLDAQGIDKSAGEVATVSISENIVPNVEDWDSFYKFISRYKRFDLLERRAAAAPFRELLEDRRGKPIPGVQSYPKRTLNLRKR